jgi:hypothetical protein
MEGVAFDGVVNGGFGTREFSSELRQRCTSLMLSDDPCTLLGCYMGLFPSISTNLCLERAWLWHFVVV